MAHQGTLTMELKNFRHKAARRLREEIVSFLSNKRIYPLMYQSWWHARFRRSVRASHNKNFLTAVPNPGAGIGHQMANWIAGVRFAREFGLCFAHTPFSSEKWESLLGFGEEEVTAKELVYLQKYSAVRLPIFDEFNASEVARVKKIIASYTGEKVLFLLEQDQGFRDHFQVMDTLQKKFYTSKSRKMDLIHFSPANYNIAVHIRRGDIVDGHEKNDPSVSLRWLDSGYFINVLASTLMNLRTAKPVKIYIFSEGYREQFVEFEKMGNTQLCLDMNAYDSFLHMVNADLLITSKSSFSYKPALLSRGIKVCPRHFWHGYPDQADWIQVADDGILDQVAIRKLQSLQTRLLKLE